MTAGHPPPVQYGLAVAVPGEMLRLGAEFQRLRELGGKYPGRHVVLIVAASDDGVRRCGIICGKRYSKRAVDRNRARRLLKESYRLIRNRIAPVHLGMIPRQSMKDQSTQTVQQDLIRQLRRAGCWIAEGDGA